MTYAVKYRMLYKNTFEELQRVDFLVKDYEGEIEHLVPGANPFVIENNKDVSGDQLGSLNPTKYIIEAISTETFNSFEFDSENYGDVVIAKYNEEDNLQVYGIVNPFETQDLYEQFGSYVVSIGAECGLSFLKTIAYFDVENDAPYVGRSKLIDIIYRCLNQIPYPEQFGLKSINNTKVKAGTTLVNEDTDFYQLITDNETMQLSLYSYDNCYNVLKQAIGPDCELFFSEGFWWIRNIPELGQTTSYVTTYLPDGTSTSYVIYDKTGKSVTQNGILRPLKNGYFGLLYSQKDVKINTNPGYLINYLKNPNFALWSDVLNEGLVYWGDSVAFEYRIDDFEHGGTGTESDPYYYQINGSVYSPTLEETDTQFIESTGISFYPFGRLSLDYLEPQNLLLSGNIEIGTMIKALRFQIIVTNNADVSYYLNNEDTWQTDPVFYLKEISATQRKGDFSIELPAPPPPAGEMDFNVAYEYYFTLRIFRGEQLYENSGTPSSDRTFFVKLFQINVNKRPSLFKESIDGKSEIFVANKYSDRESKKTIDLKIGAPNYPYAYGSLYQDTESETLITGFYYFNDIVIEGLPGSTYSSHIAEGYLKVLGDRLKYVEIPLHGKITYADILSIDGDLYRVVNLSYNERHAISNVKAVELSFSNAIVPYTKDTAFLQNTVKPVGISEYTLLEKGRATAKGDNFSFSIDELGKRYFSVNDNLKISSVVPRDNIVSIGDYDEATSTEVKGKFGIKNINEKLGSLDVSGNTDDRTYTFPDRDIEVNQWNDLADVPDSFPPDTSFFLTDYGATGTVNGINKIFQTSQDFVTGSTRVYLNGVRQFRGSGKHYTETGSNEITFSEAPETGEDIIIDYIKST